MDLGRIGIWSGNVGALPAGEAQAAAAEVESLGYGALWIPEATGRESFSFAGLLLAATSRIVIATGITNLWGRDPITMAAAQQTLAEAYPGRFLLGIGVSHQPLVEGVRHHQYQKPLSTMRGYLEGMDAFRYSGPAPAEAPVRVLAALRRGMLKLSATHAGGAHPYFVPVAHTTLARQVMGAGPLLAPEQAITLRTDREAAHRLARAHMRGYLRLPNYVNNLRELGFGDDDFQNDGSDRLVEAIVACGDAGAAAARVRAHLEAGADHVCLQVLGESFDEVRNGWRELASLVKGAGIQAG